MLPLLVGWLHIKVKIKIASAELDNRSKVSSGQNGALKTCFGGIEILSKSTFSYT
jgi:hypothetical protein